MVDVYIRFHSCGVWVRGPGAPLTYFTDRGVRRIFLGLKSWPKGIFYGSMKDAGILWVAKKKQGLIFFFLGGGCTAFFVSSDQQ